MFDFTSSPIIRTSFQRESAPEVYNQQGKAVSKGKEKSRMRLSEDNKISIAVHSSFSTKEPELSLFQRQFNVIIKIKNDFGEEGYVVLNSESLRKRLGLSKEDFKKCKDGTESLLDKICNTYAKKIDGKRGIGEYVFPGGGKYEGLLADGKMEGRGLYTFPDKSVYDGEFEGGKMHGIGISTESDGEKSIGNFQNGKMNGIGTRRWPSGDEYAGNFKDDLEHGEGTYTYSDGSKYMGEFENGDFNGRGILRLSHGSFRSFF